MKQYSDEQVKRTRACVQAICSKIADYRNEIPVDFRLNKHVWWNSNKKEPFGTGIIVDAVEENTNLFVLCGKEFYYNHDMEILLDLIENWSKYYQIILDHRNGDKRVNEILDNFMDSL